jgi:1,4-alpha-glucan branching enzyme
MKIHASHEMPFGAQTMQEGVRFRLWAPAQAQVKLALEDGGDKLLSLNPVGEGWFELTSDAARAGSHYRYVLSDGRRVPDPASRFQPGDVEGPSEVIAPCAYDWSDGDWQGRPWEEAIVYELHVGCFAGDFDGVRSRLDHLERIGVSAVELMPVADFAGARNWGYDGVLPYAPDSAYGRPENLKRLVDACHARGLMILLDVVYNHFGPSGNYLGTYAPEFFTDRVRTPWGNAIDFTRRTVRDFFIHNALYWLEEYRFDGLRFDAVDQIRDMSPKHILAEIAETVHGCIPDRHIHLVLENDDNAAHYLARKKTPSNSPFREDAQGGEKFLPSPLPPTGGKGEREGVSSSKPALYTAQWNDDFHHAAHLIATGESDGYYADYAGAPVADFARALAEGFIYQGEYSVYRERKRGEKSEHLPPSAFVTFLQNHDQIGNRAFGERITALAREQRLRALYALLFLSPSIPLLFMGEEWAASSPFLFFCDFEGDLGAAVREGRRKEFARFAAFGDSEARARIPDPTAKATFARSRLNWNERDEPPHADWLALISGLITLRRRALVPRLSGIASGEARMLNEQAFIIAWPLAQGGHWYVVANFGDTPIALPSIPGRRVHADPGSDARELVPNAVRVSCDGE